jgi:hypothetical protein
MMSTVTIDIVELQAVYGFWKAIPINLEVVDNDWLETRCDVVSYARPDAPVALGFWLAEGFAMEISAIHIVSANDPRASQTLDGPVSFRFHERSNQ